MRCVCCFAGGDRRAASGVDLSDSNLDTPLGRKALRRMYDAIVQELPALPTGTHRAAAGVQGVQGADRRSQQGRLVLSVSGAAGSVGARQEWNGKQSSQKRRRPAQRRSRPCTPSSVTAAISWAWGSVQRTSLRVISRGDHLLIAYELLIRANLNQQVSANSSIWSLCSSQTGATDAPVPCAYWQTSSGWG